MGSTTGQTTESFIRGVLRLLPVLTLAITGGAILPVPAAFAQSGLLASSIFFFTVAWANVYTCDLLLWQAHATGCLEYEMLALSVGGRWWKAITEVSLQVLILGSVATGFSQLGEVITAGFRNLWHGAHGPFVQDGGQLPILLAAAIVAPLSICKHMHSLEYIADAGFLVVAALVVVVIVNSLSHGLPALHDGSFPVWNFYKAEDLADTISTFSFMFYLQPILMPMLPGVSKGVRGIKLLSWSVWLTVLGTSTFIYYLTGFFGAAQFGRDAIVTGNILDNDLGGGMLHGIINILFAGYIMIAVAPYELASRNTTEHWVRAVFGERGRSWRWGLETLAFYTITVGIALLFPGRSAKALTITGATGVAMVSYIIPITNHWLLYFNRAVCQHQALAPAEADQLDAVIGLLPPMQSETQPLNMAAPLLGDFKDPEDGSAVAPPPMESAGVGMKNEYPSFAESTLAQRTAQILIPGVVLVIGIFTSIVTLVTVNDSDL